MPYSITKTQRSLMILCVAVLILQSIYAISIDILIPSFKPDHSQQVVLNILKMIAYSYFMFMLFNYFMHHKLKVLQIVTLVETITEIVGTIITMSQKTHPVAVESMSVINKALFAANNIVYNMAFLVWFIFLFIAGRKAYPPLFSLQKYGFGILFINLLAGLMPILVNMQDFSLYFRIIHLVSALNYLFLLEFTLKVPQINTQDWITNEHQ